MVDSLVQADLDLVASFLRSGRINRALNHMRAALNLKHFEHHELQAVFHAPQFLQLTPQLRIGSALALSQVLRHFPDRWHIATVIEEILASFPGESAFDSLCRLLRDAFVERKDVCSRETVAGLTCMLAEAWRQLLRFSDLDKLLRFLAQLAAGELGSVRQSPEFSRLVVQLARTACVAERTEIVRLVASQVHKVMASASGDEAMLLPAELASALGNHAEAQGEIARIAHLENRAFPNPFTSRLRERLSSPLAIARAAALWLGNDRRLTTDELLRKCRLVQKYVVTEVLPPRATMPEVTPLLFDSAEVYRCLLKRGLTALRSGRSSNLRSRLRYASLIEDASGRSFPCSGMQPNPTTAEHLVEEPRGRVLAVSDESKKWEAVYRGVGDPSVNNSKPLCSHASPDVPFWRSAPWMRGSSHLMTSRKCFDFLKPNRTWIFLHLIDGRVVVQAVWTKARDLAATDPLCGPRVRDLLKHHSVLAAELERGFNAGSFQGMATAHARAFRDWLTWLDQAMEPIRSSLPEDALADRDVIIRASGAAAAIPVELLTYIDRPLIACVRTVRNTVDLRTQLMMDQMAAESKGTTPSLRLVSGSYLPDGSVVVMRPFADDLRPLLGAGDQSSAPGYLRHRLQKMIAAQGLGRNSWVILDSADAVSAACTSARLREIVNGHTVGVCLLLAHGVRGGGLILDENIECFGRARIDTLLLVSCDAGYVDGAGDTVARGVIPRMVSGGDRVANVLGFREPVHDVTGVHVATALCTDLATCDVSLPVARASALRDTFSGTRPAWSAFSRGIRESARLMCAATLASSVVYSGDK